jgi:hypothetical protein
MRDRNLFSVAAMCAALAAPVLATETINHTIQFGGDLVVDRTPVSVSFPYPLSGDIPSFNPVLGDLVSITLSTRTECFLTVEVLSDTGGGGASLGGDILVDGLAFYGYGSGNGAGGPGPNTYTASFVAEVNPPFVIDEMINPDAFLAFQVGGMLDVTWAATAAADPSPPDTSLVTLELLGDGATFISITYTYEPDPCPADYNDDGVVNSQDFVAFLNAFTTADWSADFNADGVVNSQDFVAFLNAFVAGC